MLPGPLPECCQLDVAECHRLLQPVLPRLLASDVWEEVRLRWQVHPALCARAGQVAGKVHIRAVDGTTGRAAAVRSRPEGGRVQCFAVM